MLVSIIVPTFNRAGMLLELLDSIVAQAHRPVEVVVVDDCSTDETCSVVKGFFAGRSGGTDVFHVYERLDRQSGAPATRNRGAALARGEALMFVDSDDLLAPSGLSELARRLGSGLRLGYTYGKVAITGESLVPTEWIGVVGDAFDPAPESVAGYHWHTMGALYRRDCLRRVGSWLETLSGSQDWEFQARVKLFGGQCEFVDTLVGYWRQHESGRVGATSFRPDYVTSVMKASDSILRNARQAGCCDDRLEEKLARRLALHAVEWGARGYLAEREECLAKARLALAGRRPKDAFLGVLLACPQFADRAVLRLIHLWQGRR